MLIMTSGPIYWVPVLYIYILGPAVARSTLQDPSPVRLSGHESRLIALAEACKSLRLPGHGSRLIALAEACKSLRLPGGNGWLSYEDCDRGEVTAWRNYLMQLDFTA